MDFQLFYSFGKEKDRAMLCHMSVFNLLTSGHVTPSHTSGFFNNQTLCYCVHNLQFLKLNLLNSSIQI